MIFSCCSHVLQFCYTILQLWTGIFLHLDLDYLLVYFGFILHCSNILIQLLGKSTPSWLLPLSCYPDHDSIDNDYVCFKTFHIQVWGHAEIYYLFFTCLITKLCVKYKIIHQFHKNFFQCVLATGASLSEPIT